MKPLIFALGLALAATTQAATHEHDLPQQQTQAVTSHVGEGLLKAINAKDSKVQIAHEPIAELGWPAMTMWFALHAPLPQDIKVGDGVRFELQQKNGKWVITRIESGK